MLPSWPLLPPMLGNWLRRGMLIHKFSNRASLRGHPNAALYKGIGISSKCRQLCLLYGKEKCILKGYSLCNRTGFTTYRTAPWHSSTVPRAEVLLLPPPLLHFSWAQQHQTGTAQRTIYPVRTVPASHSTDFQLPNMPIIKFLKGEACTKASGSHPVWSHERHAFSSGAAAEWAKPFLKAEGLLQLFSSLQDPLNPSASSSCWHSGVDKIRSRLSTAQQKGAVKWARKCWKPSRVGRRQRGRGVPSWERGGTCEQSCREGVLWQSSSAGACAHSTGWNWWRGGGKGWLERRQLFCGLSAIRFFFFLPFLPLPVSPSQPPNTGEQAGRKSVLKRI